MPILRWIPYRDLLFLQERLSRVFNETLVRFGDANDISSSAWAPPTDIYETEDEIIIKVELPGVGIDDVDLEVKENSIVLKGERRLRKDLKQEHYHRMECSYGYFQRAFTLAPLIDKNELKASFRDGVLILAAPKAKEPQSRHIKVETE